MSFGGPVEFALVGAAASGDFDRFAARGMFVVDADADAAVDTDAETGAETGAEAATEDRFRLWKYPDAELSAAELTRGEVSGEGENLLSCAREGGAESDASLTSADVVTAAAGVRERSEGSYRRRVYRK